MAFIENISERSTRPIGRTTLGRLTGALVVFVVSALLFSLLAGEVSEGETQAIDMRMLEALQNLQSENLTSFIGILTISGSVIVGLITMTVLVAVLLRSGRRRAAIFAAVSIGGVLVVFSFLKLFFARDRPAIHNLISESTYSFPSGHASISCTLALTLIVLFWFTKWRMAIIIGGVLYVCLIGFSRMYLAVHYPTDILAGWLLSFAWVTVVASLVGAIHWQKLSRLFSDRS